MPYIAYVSSILTSKQFKTHKLKYGHQSKHLHPPFWTIKANDAASKTKVISHKINDRMIMYDEMGKTGEKATVHYLKLKYQNFPRGTEKNHGSP